MTANGRAFCTVCLSVFTPMGESLACESCGSLQRHRLMLLMLIAQIESLSTGRSVLDFSPLPPMAAATREIAGRRYVSFDLDPTSRVSIVADLCQLPIADESSDVIHCSHVLEHVVDDAAAMTELRRVLAPGGEVLIQVPRRKGAMTEEAVGAGPEELLRRFGQEDHVRLYGEDFEERLEAAGFRVHTSSYRSLLPEPALDLIGIDADHELWIAGTDPGRSPAVAPDSLMRVLADRMLKSQVLLEVKLGEAIDNLESARRQAEEWRSHYEWLASNPVIRLGRRVKRLARLGRRQLSS